MAVDRENRNRLIAELDRYLNAEITQEQFDESAHHIFVGTSDSTLRRVLGSLWVDLDEEVRAIDLLRINKSSWDYCQRVKLLLLTDGHIVTESRMRWDGWQLVAAGLFGLVWWEFAITGWQSLGILILWKLGIAARQLGRARNWGETLSEAGSFSPFSDYEELLTARRLATGFQKQPCPHPDNAPTPRSRVSIGAGRLCESLWRSMFSLIMLVVSAFPVRTTSTRVKFSS